MYLRTQLLGEKNFIRVNGAQNSEVVHKTRVNNVSVTFLSRAFKS